MKKILFAALAIAIFSFSSCKRCYTCGVDEKKVCKGDIGYEGAKKGFYTNENGQEVKCF